MWEGTLGTLGTTVLPLKRTVGCMCMYVYLKTSVFQVFLCFLWFAQDYATYWKNMFASAWNAIHETVTTTKIRKASFFYFTSNGTNWLSVFDKFWICQRLQKLYTWILLLFYSFITYHIRQIHVMLYLRKMGKKAFSEIGTTVLSS